MKTKLVPKNAQTSCEVLFQEPVCGLCGKTDNNIEKYGEKLTDKETNLSVHYYCLILSSGLWQHGKDNEGFYGFLLHDIKKEIARASKKTCSICKQKGASIGCSAKNCHKSFHFPCGLDKECIFQFFQTFGSYCWDHVPIQKVAPGTIKAVCAVCLDTVQPVPNYSVLRSPCCKYTWFHRTCLQKHALSAGLFFFKCPICNNKDSFQKEMLRMGIHIPERDASWELEENAFSELLHRHQQCDAEECLCNKGRKYFESRSKWYILRCSCCGSRGAHLICSGLGNSRHHWTCSECLSILSSESEGTSSMTEKQLPLAMSSRNTKNMRSVKRPFQTLLEGSTHDSSSVPAGSSRRSHVAGSKPAKHCKKQERKGKRNRRRAQHCRLTPRKGSKRLPIPFSRRTAGRR
ncbi:G2/M phase-specific E3 ubiquitin-protein ligase-like [Microcaecilia unicolor]|uniref:G2/M phase-specific E3 ubiquitin-protein ligase-like n=1 Tax=Microcaecilia unicolor TaxID=1415580 RepID=A0A6P7XJQ7_9AMPH|nr:G2/M phase-specific E3 ubiquitin-protein ligase-like [Microcaecilia unicolor]